MALIFPVSIAKMELLRKSMERLNIQESDLKETFVKASGNGGQNVNKVSTAVRLVHLPSGIQIQCSIYRTQALNRYKARALLCNQLAESLVIPEEMKRNKEAVRKKKRKNDQKRRSKKKYAALGNIE
ncbi:RF-1 domain protein [Leptospira ryugenii]|uniref:RF-1 domain protein n=1 Tax=Leptospira ryugenii TaxID=1917863 RepID=A0A2P2DYR1_9LEPT|nr:peptide chain release factor-like protein [Leptospira ryugenii]GBF49746.1 RF-1 domain protein [Leptospira ryugenii]